MEPPNESGVDSGLRHAPGLPEACQRSSAQVLSERVDNVDSHE